MFYIKSIKFNENEFKKLKEIIRDEKFSTYVKAKIFNFKKSNQRLKIAIETVNSYNERNNQIKRIGTNLNQIAKYCNQNKTIDILVLKRIDEILQELRKFKNDS